MSTPDSLAPRWRSADQLQRLLRFAMAVSAAASWLALLGLAARRWSGGLQQPLSFTALLAAGATVLAAAAAFRWAAWFSGWGQFALLAFPTAATLVFGWLVSLPDSSAAGLLSFWGLLLIEEAGAWWWLTRSTRPARQRTAAAPGPRESSLRAAVEQGEVLEDEGLPQEVTQQLTRVVEPEGAEVLYALLRVAFSPGERTQPVHLAFCPPLPGKPVLSVDQLDGAAVHAKATQVESFGARLELRLAETCRRSTSVVVQVLARCDGGDTQRGSVGSENG